MNINKVFCIEQYGFIKGKSCVAQLLKFVEDIRDKPFIIRLKGRGTFAGARKGRNFLVIYWGWSELNNPWSRMVIHFRHMGSEFSFYKTKCISYLGTKPPSPSPPDPHYSFIFRFHYFRVRNKNLISVS